MHTHGPREAIGRESPVEARKAGSAYSGMAGPASIHIHGPLREAIGRVFPIEARKAGSEYSEMAGPAD